MGVVEAGAGGTKAGREDGSYSMTIVFTILSLQLTRSQEESFRWRIYRSVRLLTEVNLIVLSCSVLEMRLSKLVRLTARARWWRGSTPCTGCPPPPRRRRTSGSSVSNPYYRQSISHNPFYDILAVRKKKVQTPAPSL